MLVTAATRLLQQVIFSFIDGQAKGATTPFNINVNINIKRSTATYCLKAPWQVALHTALFVAAGR